MTMTSVLPHWICPSCRAFNGAGKRVHYICRVCGASKPSNGAPEQYDTGALVRVLRDLAEENVLLNERLTELQSRESRFVLARQHGFSVQDLCEHQVVQSHRLKEGGPYLQWCEQCGSIRFGPLGTGADADGAPTPFTEWIPPVVGR